MHLPNIKQKITNQELCDIFKCSTQGGMRRSLKTKTLVLVTKTYGQQTYINYWENDILYLTGMGLTGDQTLSSQNKTLSESDSNNVTLHLFENNARNSYIYEGVVTLAGPIIKKDQKDKDGNNRKVYIFPLKKINTI